MQGRGRGGDQRGRKLHTPGLAQVQALRGWALVSRALTSTAGFTGQEAPLSPGSTGLTGVSLQSTRVDTWAS